MRQITTGIIIALSLIAMAAPSYASDWDKAGKVLAAIEGVRILTGGRVDPIGNIAGINNNYNCNPGCQNTCNYAYPAPAYGPHRVWVPHYRWETRYIPKYIERRGRHGRRIVTGGYYIRVRVEDGGHWEY